MNHVAVQVGLTALSSVLTGLLCGLVAVPWLGSSAVGTAMWAVLAALPAGTVVVCYFHFCGVSLQSIVAGTMIRAVLTLLVAGLMLGIFPGFRQPVFILTVGVVYLVNLTVETWFVYEKLRKSGPSRTSV